MRTIRFGAMMLLAPILMLGWPDPARAGEATEAEGETEINNGQDITRPLTRFDIRYQYQNAPGSDNDTVQVATLRMDRPFSLNDRWKIATRMDVPLMATNRPGPDNPNGHTHFGLSDLLVQGLVVNTVTDTFAWAAGTELILPTATEDAMGTGRWRVGPLTALRWKTDGLLDLKGSWFALAARWDRDFAEARDNSTRTNELQMAPIIYIPLPRQAFVNLFPSLDIRYNLGRKRPGDEGRWFVPADVMVGKMLRKNMIGTVEASVPIVNDYKVYDFKLELRLGILF